MFRNLKIQVSKRRKREVSKSDQIFEIIALHQKVEKFLWKHAGLKISKSDYWTQKSLNTELIITMKEGMSDFLKFLHLAKEMDLDYWDNKEYLRLYTKHLGMRCSEDYIDSLDNGDIVEGYNPSRIQMLRNLPYMEITNYSLLDIITHEWPELYHRTNSITKLILDAVNESCVSGLPTFHVNIPRHYIREALAHPPQTCEVNFKYCAPLFEGPGRISGVLMSSSATVQPEVLDNIEFI